MFEDNGLNRINCPVSDLAGQTIQAVNHDRLHFYLKWDFTLHTTVIDLRELPTDVNLTSGVIVNSGKIYIDGLGAIHV